MPGQRVLQESLVTDPPLACDRYTDPIVKNRFVRFNAEHGCAARELSRHRGSRRRSPRACPTLQRCLSASCRSDVLRFILPSRYCESDALMRMAVLEFGALTQGAQRVEAICAWIRDHIKYEVGTTQATHSAFDTVTGRAGVCRDFAHLAIAFCRALNIPARFVPAYATFADPPPDFHAVFEAYLGGRLAPLRSDRARAAVGPGADRYRAGRRGRRFRDHLRARAHDLYVPAHRAHRHATQAQPIVAVAAEPRVACQVYRDVLSRLQLGAQQRRRVLPKLFPPGPAAPFVEADAMGVRSIALKHRHLFARESDVVHVEIRLVVQAERTVVEVGRADRHQHLVHHHDLAMEHGRMVLVDLDARPPTARPISRATPAARSRNRCGHRERSPALRRRARALAPGCGW